MADVKISALPAVTSIGPTDIFPIVKGTTTSKITWADATVVAVTYTAFKVLQGAGNLVPGVIYKISEFNRNMPVGNADNPSGYLPTILYDDGTNPGITIYVEALTTTEVSDSGYGIFYNPSYSGVPDYFNTDGTGLYQIWDGDNPDPLEVPAYAVNDVVFWGGYAWRNVTGNVGVALDVYTLNSDWTKLPYSNNNYYYQELDEIKVDWIHGILIERYNVKNNVRVSGTAEGFWQLYNSSNFRNPIADMGWGIYSSFTQGSLYPGDYCINDVTVLNSVCELVNFKGGFIKNTKFINSAYFYDNYIGFGSKISGLLVENLAEIESNEFLHSSSLLNITVSSDTYVSNNTLDNSAIISRSKFTTSQLFGNVLNQSSFITNVNVDFNSAIANNIMTNASGIYNSVLYNGSNLNNNQLSSTSNISDIVLENQSFISNNILDASFINYNILQNTSYIQYNGVMASSYIQKNKVINNSAIIGSQLISSNIEHSLVSNNSLIKDNLLISSYMTNNTLSTAIFDFSASGYLNGVTIQSNNAYNVDATENISTATNIYASFTKNIFTRSDGVPKLSFINGANALVIGGINS